MRVEQSVEMTSRPRGRGMTGAGRRSPMPGFIEPELATLVSDVPDGPGWLHEVKLDGYRVQCHVSRGSPRLLTRRGLDWTDRMPSLAAALSQLPVKDAILDGELVAMRRNGITDFQLLQNSLSAGYDRELTYCAFDLIHWNGFDLREESLAMRKQALSMILSASSSDRVRYAEHFAGSGEDFRHHACEMGLEGIISKRSDQPYRSGRGRDWLKIKCLHCQEFVIGGYTLPEGSRDHLGALLLGVPLHEGRSHPLTYVGKVGTGFSAESLAELGARLAGTECEAPPFDNPPRGADGRRCRYVAPLLVAEVDFTSRTHDGLLRHASFRGLRDDKSATDVTLEEPIR